MEMLSINRIFTVIIFSCLLLCPAYADIGNGGVDLQSLYNRAPIVCYVTIDDWEKSSFPFFRKEGLFVGSDKFTLNVHHYYKGDGPAKIKLTSPRGGMLWDLRTVPYDGYSWCENERYAMCNIKKGRGLIVFLKKERRDYRFFSEENKYIPVLISSFSKANDFQALREDIVNSVVDDDPSFYVHNYSANIIDQIKRYGWIEAVPKLRAITMDQGFSKYAQAVLARLYLGDRTAINETLHWFDKEKQYTQEDSIFLFDVQNSWIHAYAQLGIKKGQDLMKAILDGKMPWLHGHGIAMVKWEFENRLIPENIIKAGDLIANAPVGKCVLTLENSDAAFMLSRLRADWAIAWSELENREKICQEMKSWWQQDGRQIFIEETKE